MNDKEEIKNLIGELKKVVMELHRSAGNLDDIIQNLEQEIDDGCDYYFKLELARCRQYRKDYSKIHSHDSLTERESEIWQKIIEQLDKN